MKSTFFVAWGLNIDDVIKSSSGGIFYILGRYFIKNGGYVCGAVFNDSFSSLYHILSNESSCLEKIRGSKYANSILGIKLFNDVSNKLQTSKVLFSGCPCQISALEFYLNKKNISTENLYTCSLVCHGSPSFSFLRTYLNNLEKKFNSKIINIKFRNKNERMKYGILIEFQNDQKIDEYWLNNEFIQKFLSDKYLRDCCYKCKFKDLNNLKGDIILGDFWGVQEEYPQFYNLNGTSLIIINNKRGQELISLIQNEIFIKEIDFNKAIKHNPMLSQSATDRRNKL